MKLRKTSLINAIGTRTANGFSKCARVMAPLLRRSDDESGPAASTRWRRRLAAAFLVLVCQLIASCAGTAVEPYAGATPRTEALYVIAGGWHTEIGLPVQAMSGRLLSLQEAAFGAKYLVIGWGQRDYYMAAHPGFGDLLGAVVAGPAVMLVIPLEVTPAEAFGPSNVFTVHVSPEGFVRLSEYLWDDLQKDPSGTPHPIAAGPYSRSAFYPSTGTYEIVRTCNTWTAEALRVAGLPVRSTGVVFAGQVLEQVRQLDSPARN